MSAKHSVLFVCYGNICRSTMGEAIFKDLIKKKGIADQWIVDSAGTGNHEAGSPCDRTAQRVLSKHGLKSDHIARQIRKEDFEKFQYIFVFDHFNMSEIQQVTPKTSKADIKLLNYYNPNERNKEIDDPWGYGDKVFDKVYKDCHDSCEEFLRKF